MIDCLGGKAIDYVRELRIGNDFRLLKEKLSRRFGAKGAPITVRRGLQFISQEENESLEEYSQRVHFLVMDGYTGAREKTIEHLSVEYFLRGCLDKRAAEVAMDKNPQEIHKAVQCVKDAINNRKAIYGKSSTGHSAMTRRVSYANPGLFLDDESVTSNYNLRTVSAKESQSNSSDKDLSKRIEDLEVMFKKFISGSPQGIQLRSLTPTTSPQRSVCFQCNKQGHFQKYCPLLTANREMPSVKTFDSKD